LRLRASDRRRLDALLARSWSLPAEEHPLGRLQGRSLGGYRLLALLGPKNQVGARYLQLFLVDSRGCLSDEATAVGLYNSGLFPGFNWIDLVRFHGMPAFEGDPLRLNDVGRDRRLFRLLSSLVPAGGHLMVEYESASQRESERLLALGYPPAATPLGHLLFQAGCRSFRDWYISEGGREGPRKLQGFKPLDESVARDRAVALRDELSKFLSSPAAPRHGQRGRTARRLAQAALGVLAREREGAGEAGRDPP
jgi:hypothetical protein